MARPVIVVSTGRSGSTLISNMVREHPEVLSLSELFILLGDAAFPEGPVSGVRFWDILSRPRPQLHVMQRSGITFPEILYRPGPNPRFTEEAGIPPVLLIALPHLVGDPEALFDEIGAWTQGLDTSLAADQYRRLFDWLCRRLNRRIWVERSGASLLMARELARQFPEAGIVHLHRDGRECAMSMSRHDGFKLMALASRPDLAPASLRRGDLMDRDVLARTELPLEVFGGVWSDMIVAGTAGLAELPPDRMMTMSYEALLAAPHHELRRLAAFIGVEPDPAWLEHASGIVRTKPPTWTAIPEPERQRLVDACWPGMDLLQRS